MESYLELGGRVISSSKSKGWQRVGNAFINRTELHSAFLGSNYLELVKDDFRRPTTVRLVHGFFL